MDPHDPRDRAKFHDQQTVLKKRLERHVANVHRALKEARCVDALRTLVAAMSLHGAMMGMSVNFFDEAPSGDPLAKQWSNIQLDVAQDLKELRRNFEVVCLRRGPKRAGG